jgi:hypothetical protein
LLGGKDVRQSETLGWSHRIVSIWFLTEKTPANCQRTWPFLEQGYIVDVNESWKTFAQDNEFRGSNFGIGLNYLDVCRSGTGAAVEFGDQLQRLLNAELNLINLVYSCDSPRQARWFSLIALPLTDRRAAVIHIDLSSVVRSPLAASIESSSESIARAVRYSVSRSLNLPFARMDPVTQLHLGSAACNPNDHSDLTDVRARLTQAATGNPFAAWKG